MATPFPSLEAPLSDLELINQEDTPPDPYKGVGDLISNIIREIDKQERPTREILIKTWKYLELLWNGIANFYWNSTTNQWQPITYDDIRHLSESSDLDPTLLNKTVNMIRPYGESIIGVLTTDIPRVKFFPENADNIDDINTAKAYCNIEKKIQQDNIIRQKLAKIIKYLLTGGFSAVYNYTHTSDKYGEYTEKTYKDKKFRITNYECSSCGNTIYSNRVDLPDSEGYDTIDTSQGIEVGQEIISEPLDNEHEGTEKVDQESKVGELLQEEQEVEPESLTCPTCSLMAPPLESVEEGSEQVEGEPRIIPKSRQLFNVYGPLNVKIPTKATRKEECYFLLLEEEIHESIAKSLYPNYQEQIQPGSHTDLAYDRWARSQYENMGEINQYYVTIRKLWLRPSGYYLLGNEEQQEKLKTLFPSGLLAIFCTNTFLFAEGSDMDDHWTLSYNPVYERLYGDPLLKAGIPLQETANDLFQLELETVKYSIPQTFADPLYFDFEAYSKSKAQPGLIYPMKASPAGKSMGDVFFETRTASLPKEVEVLETKIQELFQFVLGVFPSVFGGDTSGGSRTLGEYEQSRGQALQRLNINPWDIVVNMYAEMMSKAVKHYAEDLMDDEVFVMQKGQNFINVWIRKAELGGSVGEVRPEVAQQFPTSWGQKKAAILELLGMNNEAINSVLFHPENVNLLSQYLSIEQMYIPGDDQRNKQLSEIKVLSQGMPLVDEASGMPLQSSVSIEIVDDNEIHASVLEAFICSEAGQSIKETNPQGYMNLLAHLQEHQQALAMQQAQEQIALQAQNAQAPPQKAPKLGEANV